MRNILLVMKNNLYRFTKEKAMMVMKEVWGYMMYMFSDNKKYDNKIKKAQK